MNKMDQQVLCVENFDRFQPGFHREHLGRWFHQYLDETQQVFFKRRGDAEDNPKWLQIIPYVLAERGQEVLSYCRSPLGGEQRLHGKWSVGFGGHIEREDANSELKIDSIVAVAAIRELREELGFEKQGLVFPLFEGYVYDPSNPVGSVHLGVVYRADVTNCEFHFGEEVHLPTWTTYGKLDPELMETWSQLVVGGFR